MSTSPKSAEGRAGDLKIAKNHEFSKVDQPKLRSGSRGRFAIIISPAQPSADFRLVDPRKLVVICSCAISSWPGAHFLEAVNPKPLPSQGDLLQSALDVSSKRCRAIGIAYDTLLKNFCAHARAQFFSLNFYDQTFYSKKFAFEAFLTQIRDPVADGCLFRRDDPKFVAKGLAAQ